MVPALLLPEAQESANATGLIRLMVTTRSFPLATGGKVRKLAHPIVGAVNNALISVTIIASTRTGFTYGRRMRVAAQPVRKPP